MFGLERYSMERRSMLQFVVDTNNLRSESALSGSEQTANLANEKIEDGQIDADEYVEMLSKSGRLLDASFICDNRARVYEREVAHIDAFRSLPLMKKAKFIFMQKVGVAAYFLIERLSSISVRPFNEEDIENEVNDLNKQANDESSERASSIIQELRSSRKSNQTLGI